MSRNDPMSRYGRAPLRRTDPLRRNHPRGAATCRHASRSVIAGSLRGQVDARES